MEDSRCMQWRKGVRFSTSPTRCSFINCVKGLWISHIDPCYCLDNDDSSAPQGPFPAASQPPARSKWSKPAGLDPLHIHASSVLWKASGQTSICTRFCWVTSGMVIRHDTVWELGLFLPWHYEPWLLLIPCFDFDKQRDPDINPAAVSGYIWISLQLPSFN